MEDCEMFKWNLFPAREDHEECLLCFGNLGGTNIVGFDSGGEKMLFFPSVLEVLGYPSPVQVSNDLHKLNIPLQKCTPHKLHLILTTLALTTDQNNNNDHHIIKNPPALISQSNAERIYKLYMKSTNISHSTNNNNFDNYSIRVTMETELSDSPNQQTQGLLFPYLYVNEEAPCIQCITKDTKCVCNNQGDHKMLYSPTQFFSHCLNHKESFDNEEEEDKENNGRKECQIRECHWGLSANNWRLYIKLVDENNDDDSQYKRYDDNDHHDDEEEIVARCRVLKQKILEDVKIRFIHQDNNQSDIRNVSTNYHSNSSSSCPSLNTSPSMPTPSSLSPVETGLQPKSQESSNQIQNNNSLLSDSLFSPDKWNVLIPALLQLSQDRLFTISLLQQELFKSLITAFILSSQNLLTEQQRPQNNEDHEQNNVNTLLTTIKHKTDEFKRRVQIFEQNRKRKIQLNTNNRHSSNMNKISRNSEKSTDYELIKQEAGDVCHDKISRKCTEAVLQ